MTIATPQPSVTDLTAWALAYARQGWPVFPLHTWRASRACCSCGRPDCGSPAKHPLLRHGVLEASADPAQVLAWWTRWPGANIGVATGVVSGVWVLDIDPAHGGAESLADMTHTYGPLPDTVSCDTGGGGQHYYWRMPPWGLANAVGVAAGVDVRSDGGYVVAPPSRHRSGRAYAWHGEGHPADHDPAFAPRWLLDVVRVRAQRRTAPLPETFVEGMRDNSLTSAAGALRRRGLGEAAIRAAIGAINEVCCRPPLDELDLDRIARSVCRYTPPGDAPMLTSPASAQGLAWIARV